MATRRIFDVPAALVSLYPAAQWVHRGEGYAGIEWKDETIPCPTQEQVEAEIARLQDEYDALEYQRLRREEYPSFADQFDTLYHGGYDAWRAEIQAIKDKYPKPE
jgi:hypothetical protein